MIPQRFKDAITKPWQRTLYITFFAQLMTSVGFSSISPFLPLYVKDLGTITNLSVEILVGMVFSAQAFTMMIASPIWGIIADRYGRKLMVERAMFGGAVMLLIMAFARSAEELIILRAIQGLITGSASAANALVASVAPRDRTGYAMGLIQVGRGSGIALGPLIGGAVADFYGYSAAFYVTAALLFLSGVLVWVGIDEEFVPEGARVNGLSFLAQWRHVLAAPGVIVAYSMRFMNRLGRMMIYPMIPLFVVILMRDAVRINTFTGLVVGVGSATMTLSALYFGRLGDRIGHRRIVIISMIIAAVLYFGQSFAVMGWHLLVLQAFVGVMLGGILPGISALLARYTEVGEEGVVFGLDNSVQAGARTVAPLVGAFIANLIGLRATFMAAALIYLVTALLAAWGLPVTKKSGKCLNTL